MAQFGKNWHLHNTVFWPANKMLSIYLYPCSWQPGMAAAPHCYQCWGASCVVTHFLHHRLCDLISVLWYIWKTIILAGFWMSHPRTFSFHLFLQTCNQMLPNMRDQRTPLLKYVAGDGESVPSSCLGSCLIFNLPWKY